MKKSNDIFKMDKKELIKSLESISKVLSDKSKKEENLNNLKRKKQDIDQEIKDKEEIINKVLYDVKPKGFLDIALSDKLIITYIIVFLIFITIFVLQNGAINSISSAIKLVILIFTLVVGFSFKKVIINKAKSIDKSGCIAFLISPILYLILFIFIVVLWNSIFKKITFGNIINFISDFVDMLICSVLAFLVISIVCYIIYRITIRINKSKLQEKERIKQDEKKLKIEKRVDELKEKKKEIENEIDNTNKLINKKQELVSSLSNKELYKDYQNVKVIETFINYLEKGRCDSLKECINLYEQEIKNNNIKEKEKNKNVDEQEINKVNVLMPNKKFYVVIITSEYCVYKKVYFSEIEELLNYDEFYSYANENENFPKDVIEIVEKREYDEALKKSDYVFEKVVLVGYEQNNDVLTLKEITIQQLYKIRKSLNISIKKV